MIVQRGFSPPPSYHIARLRAGADPALLRGDHPRLRGDVCVRLPRRRRTTAGRSPPTSARCSAAPRASPTTCRPSSARRSNSRPRDDAAARLLLRRAAPPGWRWRASGWICAGAVRACLAGGAVHPAGLAARQHGAAADPCADRRALGRGGACAAPAWACCCLPLALLAAIPVAACAAGAVSRGCSPQWRRTLRNTWYLNLPFLGGRGRRLRRGVAGPGRADARSARSGAGRRLALVAPAGLILLALTVDLRLDRPRLTSLDPAFSSSVYGMLTGTGMTLFALSIAVLLAAACEQRAGRGARRPRQAAARALHPLGLPRLRADADHLVEQPARPTRPGTRAASRGFWGWSLGAMAALHPALGALLLLGIPALPPHRPGGGRLRRGAGRVRHRAQLVAGAAGRRGRPPVGRTSRACWGLARSRPAALLLAGRFAPFAPRGGRMAERADPLRRRGTSGATCGSGTSRSAQLGWRSRWRSCCSARCGCSRTP